MWDPILVALAAGAGVWAGIHESRKRLRAWRDAAESCGLRVLDASGWRPRLEARAGPVDVRMQTCGHKGRLTRIWVAVPGPPDFYKLRIRREAPFQSAREIEIGDKSFDRTFCIEGPTRLVFALLDAEMRRLLLRVNKESRLEIANGALCANDTSDEKVPGVLPLLLDFGQRIAQLHHIPRHLVNNANHDPETGVRLQNLLLLIRELPGAPETTEALRTACSDPSPEIRLRAAKELGAEGRDVLLKLAESLENDAVSAEAVTLLERELPFEGTKAILDRALDRRRVQTARVCLEALGRGGVTPAVDALVKVMEREEGGLATAAAQALGATGSPAAEPALILALQREQPDLRVAAADALSRVGSVTAVLPLQEATERHWLDRELHRATRQAIAGIQSRVQGASPGQLSLAGAEAGRLSLAQSEVGQLSLAPAQAGQLSLAADSAGQLSLGDAEEELK